MNNLQNKIIKQQLHLENSINKLKTINFGLDTVPKNEKKISSCIRIKFVTNNIFCTLWSVSGKRTFIIRSIGMKKINTSKKKVNFYAKQLLKDFFLEVWKWRKKNKHKLANFFFSLRIPKRFRTLILWMISRYARAINFEYSKAFNGCMPKKKRRKKRLGFRSFK